MLSPFFVYNTGELFFRKKDDRKEADRTPKKEKSNILKDETQFVNRL